MDYGKLAYLKADELASRLKTISKTKQPPPALVRVSLESASGRVPVADGAALAAAVIAKVSAKSSGTVRLIIGGLRAGEGRLESASPLVLLGAGSGSVELDFSAFEGGAKEVEAEVLFPAGASAVRSPSGTLGMATDGETYVISSAEHGDIKLVKSDARYENRTLLRAGRGKQADVCKVGDGFCAVYADQSGLLWSVAVSKDLNVSTRSLLGTAPAEFGITSSGGRVYVFFAESGKAKYFSTAYPKGTRGAAAEIDFAGNVTRVTPVKDAEPVAVVIESGGKAYLMKEKTAARASASLSVTVKGRAESV